LRSGDDAWVLEWSTVCDAPLGPGVHVRDIKDADDRIVRALFSGTSYVDSTATGEECVLFNRAGLGETVLTMDQMIDVFCRQSIDPLAGFDHIAASEEVLNAWLSARHDDLKARGLLEPPHFRAQTLNREGVATPNPSLSKERPYMNPEFVDLEIHSIDQILSESPELADQYADRGENTWVAIDKDGNSEYAPDEEAAATLQRIHRAAHGRDRATGELSRE